MIKKVVKKKVAFRPTLRTRNYTAEDLRDNLRQHTFNMPVIIRLGSLTESNIITSRSTYVEINKVAAIKVSRDKLKMKEAFTQNKVKTADWYTSYEDHYDGSGKWKFKNQTTNETVDIKTLPFPMLSKSRTGQGGVGNTLHDDFKSLESWMKGKDLSNYIFEKFYNYAREYRLHVTKDGCFLAWRKLRKENAKERWYFNSDNCVWAGEENPLFNKPVNWDNVIKDSVNALNAAGLDIGAVDVRIQSANDKQKKVSESPDYLVLEVNSAPSLGELGTKFYYKEILKLINQKLK